MEELWTNSQAERDRITKMGFGHPRWRFLGPKVLHVGPADVAFHYHGGRACRQLCRGFQPQVMAKLMYFNRENEWKWLFTNGFLGCFFVGGWIFSNVWLFGYWNEVVLSLKLAGQMHGRVQFCGPNAASFGRITCSMACWCGCVWK